VGLTSVASCAAADVMSVLANRIAGCMRGASDSGLKVESGDGKVKELAITTSSICSIKVCMMFARAFNSAITSCVTLPGRVKHLTSTVHACHTLQDAGRWVSLTEGTLVNNEGDQRSTRSIIYSFDQIQFRGL
jgi:hypothetical protein